MSGPYWTPITPLRGPFCTPIHTPAMAAGVADKLWEIGDIAALVDAADAKPTKRGPYKISK
jgi:hypothetical protein